jgi:hypothetical protein
MHPSSRVVTTATTVAARDVLLQERPWCFGPEDGEMHVAIAADGRGTKSS